MFFLIYAIMKTKRKMKIYWKIQTLSYTETKQDQNREKNSVNIEK